MAFSFLGVTETRTNPEPLSPALCTLFSSAALNFGSVDASTIPSGIVAPSKSDPRPT